VNEKISNPDFGRWAITGVLAPAVCILLLRFAIAPIFWPGLADALGDRLGYIFILYLLTVVIAATVWKVCKGRPQGSPPKAANEETDDMTE